MPGVATNHIFLVPYIYFSKTNFLSKIIVVYNKKSNVKQNF